MTSTYSTAWNSPKIRDEHTTYALGQVGTQRGGATHGAAQAVKVLVLAKRLSHSPDNPWLTDDLVRSLADRGYEVDTLLLDRTGYWVKGSHHYHSNAKVFVYSACTARSALPGVTRLKMGWLWCRALLRMRRLVRRARYDLVINFSVATIFFGIPRIVKQKNQEAKYLLILWDFFPQHQVEIGKIRSRIAGKLLYMLEHREVTDADYVGLMSPANVDYFRRYHGPHSGGTFVLPVWGTGCPNSRRNETENSKNYEGAISEARLTLVFGGQLARGRGIMGIVDCLLARRSELPEIELLILGDGELAPVLESKIMEDGTGIVKWLGQLPRSEYLELIRYADVGVVVTVPNVTVPTFPSKVIDYLRVGLPVLAAVEESTDFGRIIEDDAQCGFSIPAGNCDDLIRAVRKLAMLKSQGDLEALGVNAVRYFREVHETEKVVDRLVEYLGITDQPGLSSSHRSRMQ